MLTDPKKKPQTHTVTFVSLPSPISVGSLINTQVLVVSSEPAGAMRGTAFSVPAQQKF